MNKLKTLILSIIVALSVAGIVWAFTGPGSNQPPTGDPSFWRKSGDNVYYNVSGGNVGIGTTAPAQKLQLYTTTGNILSSIQNTNATGYSAVQLYNNVDQSYLLYGGNAYAGYAGANSLNIVGGGGPIAFFNTAAEAMRITSVGNVGIGTTGSQYRLEIQGPNGNWAQMIRGGATADQSYGLVIMAGTNSNDYSLKVQNKTGAEYLAVRGDGNVGIGTANPQGALHVRGDLQLENVGVRCQILTQATICAPGWEILGQNNTRYLCMQCW